ncbi:MAG: tyrosine-type recombinase/integrase [Clostridiales bacterium]|nr:tyrosine-type recombinase/integrase [Clostridiales bacterium]
MDSSGLKITKDTLEDYLSYLENNNREQSSIYSYRTVLNKFYGFLPDEKIITADTAREWQEYLIDRGYANRSVIQRVHVVNGFLRFLGKRDWQYDNTLVINDATLPELTRNEYLRLLQTAKVLNKERTYLIMKTLCSVGLKINELRQVTVEAAKAGRVVVSLHDQPKRTAAIPTVLATELLDYAGRNDITTGSIFVTRSGKPLNRSNVWHDIQVVCAEAHVSEEKANPSCLWRLHQTTYEGIEHNISVLVTQAYDRMLENEELTIGWGM